MHTFDTPQPVTLDVRGRGGSISVTATDDPTSSVELTALNEAGADALEQARVEQNADRIVVDIPRRGGGFLRRGPEVDIRIEVPTGSRLMVESESADIAISGTFADVRGRSGSGDIEVDRVERRADLQTGSGDVAVGGAADLRVKTGSGDVNVDQTADRAEIVLGSGDISVGEARGSVSARTGSGDVEIGVLSAEMTIKSGSGDLTVRRATSGTLRSTGASGDITVGVPEGTAAWLDLSTVTGEVKQELTASEGPSEEQQQVEISAQTVSGDVRVYRS